MTTRRPPLTRLRALPGPVWVLAGGQFINKFGAFVLFFLVIYLTRMGYSPAQAGLAAGAYGAGAFGAMFLGGSIADRIGRRGTIIGFLAERSFLWIFLGDATTSLAFGVVAFAALPRGKPEVVDAPTPGGLIAAIAADDELRHLLLGMVLAAFVLFQIATTLPLHVEALGYSTATFGILASLNGLLVAGTEIPATTVTVRLPPRIAIGTGFLVIGLAFGGLGFATAVPLMIAVVAIATMGEVLAMPVAGAFVADIAPVDMRGRYQGALGAAAAIGITAAPALGGALYGWDPTAAFAAFALAGCVAFVTVAGPALIGRKAPEKA